MSFEQKTDALRQTSHCLRTQRHKEWNCKDDSNENAAVFQSVATTIRIFGALRAVEHTGKKVGDGIGSKLAQTVIDSAIIHVVLETVRSMAL